MPLKLSIITVCFNAEKTIGSTIASVASQTYGDIEHIVVDGASTDSTVQKIGESQNRVAAWLSEPDEGIYDAMSKGIRMASGDVIGILNADDVYADEAVIERVAAVMENSSLDALYGDVAFFSPDRPESIVRRYSSKRFSPALLAWGWMPAHPTLFLRRSVFDRYGSYRKDFKIAGDYEFVTRIFKDRSLSFRYLPEALVRMSTGGASTAGWRSTLLLNREVLRACRENGIYTNWLMLLSKYPFKVLEFFLK